MEVFNKEKIKNEIESLIWEHEKRISKLEGIMYISVSLQIATFILILKLVI